MTSDHGSEVTSFALSTTSQAHIFDVALELKKRGSLEQFLCSYPLHKLRDKGLQGAKILSYPLPFMAAVGIEKLISSTAVSLSLEPVHKRLFDSWASKKVIRSDYFLATSSSGLQTGRRAQELGALWICDRPCSHILTQDQLIREEYERLGLRWPGIDPRVIATELKEYEEADLITVPSTFARNSFLQQGVSESKIVTIPYGVSVDKFYPSGEPASDKFQVIFAGQKSFQKGVRYLVDAFQSLKHPKKKLLLVGVSSPETALLLKGANLENVEMMPAVPQDRLRTLFSQSQVAVLPSVQDGFGLVMSQAMACRCPIIASEHTGAADLFTPGVEGFIDQPRDVACITQRLQTLADNPGLRDQMAEAALATAKRIGGWESYVDTLIRKCQAASSARALKASE